MRGVMPAVALVSMVIAAVGCKKPDAPVAPWSQQVEQASSQQQVVRQVQESDRVAFLEGFRHGAAMVHSALEDRRTPFRLSLDAVVPQARPQGPLPPGVERVAEPWCVEVDAATGLPWAPVLGGQGAWARGAVDGFDWALRQEQARLLQSGLVRALPPVTYPESGAWVALKDGRAAALRSERMTYRVEAASGVLLWEGGGRGYAPTRVWRPLEGHEVVAVAATDDCLWVRMRPGDGVVLDRRTGFVREVVPVEVMNRLSASEAPSQAQRDEKNRAVLRAAAERGDVPAMYFLATQLKGKAPAEALTWLRKAADRGSTQAMIALGMAYLGGQYGLPMDPAQGRAWIAKAAKAGDPEAEMGLKLLDEQRLSKDAQR